MKRLVKGIAYLVLVDTALGCLFWGGLLLALWGLSLEYHSLPVGAH